MILRLLGMKEYMMGNNIFQLSMFCYSSLIHYEYKYCCCSDPVID